MIDYEISRCTRRCFESGRELRPGEVVYSLLMSEGHDVVRRDCSEEAWQGPPEGTVGWWKTQLPKPDSSAPRMAPPQVIAQRFDHLVAHEADPQLLTVMALLMIRKRILKEDDVAVERRGPTWRLHCPLMEQTYEIPRIEVDSQRVAGLQHALMELLYGDEETAIDSVLNETASEAETERGSDAANDENGSEVEDELLSSAEQAEGDESLRDSD
ncbi:MAG: hypothetical protein KDA83_12080 [Planctomycetales bacterium]|nr:hypothetical protein [Planctomycetales bacterium]